MAVALAILLLLPNFFSAELSPVTPYKGKEKFDPSFARINSIKLLEEHTDSIALLKNITKRSFEYVELLESVIEQRFYHGFSHFNTSENWIAALAGKLIKEDFACKVQPEKIMQHPNAACSQQALVMMAVLRNKKISYRSLGLPHHYAMEVLIGNEWFFCDPNMEPGITREQRMLSHWQHQTDILKQYYDSSRYPDLDYHFGKNQMVIVGTINEIPAQKARVFHSVTGILSKTVWLFPLIFLLFRLRIKVKKPLLSFAFARRKPSLSLSA
ncbi:MAG: hypothetical protein V4685_10815 [Bacteroidota bacterium]